MAASFTDQEKQVILSKIKETAKQYASVVGIRKTTVDQLVEAADISKGMFYKLYSSKEMLFFEMLEDMHKEAYEAADLALKSCSAELPSKRTAKAFACACKVMEQSGMLGIMEKDISYLLRKIPEEITNEHYHSDEVHIRKLLEDNHLVPACGVKIAADTVRALFLTINHKTEIGDDYDTVLGLLIEGACEKMFP